MVVPALNLDLRLELVPCADRDRLRQDVALPCFLWCQPVQGDVWTVFVEPGSEVVQWMWSVLSRENGPFHAPRMPTLISPDGFRKGLGHMEFTCRPAKPL